MWENQPRSLTGCTCIFICLILPSLRQCSVNPISLIHLPKSWQMPPACFASGFASLIIQCPPVLPSRLGLAGALGRGRAGAPAAPAHLSLPAGCCVRSSAVSQSMSTWPPGEKRPTARGLGVSLYIPLSSSPIAPTLPPLTPSAIACTFCGRQGRRETEMLLIITAAKKTSYKPI